MKQINKPITSKKETELNKRIDQRNKKVFSELRKNKFKGITSHTHQLAPTVPNWGGNIIVKRKTVILGTPKDIRKAHKNYDKWRKSAPTRKESNINPLTYKKPNVKSRSKLDIASTGKEGWEDELWKVVQKIHEGKRAINPMMQIFIRKLLLQQKRELNHDHEILVNTILSTKKQEREELIGEIEEYQKGFRRQSDKWLVLETLLTNLTTYD